VIIVAEPDRVEDDLAAGYWPARAAEVCCGPGRTR